MASGIPGFVGDLRGALGALRRYDDGRNFPVPAYWEEKARRFGGTAQQRQTSDQPPPVFSRGLATLAERSLLRVQRCFSRRIPSAARDRLTQRGRAMKESGRQAALPANLKLASCNPPAAVFKQCLHFVQNTNKTCVTNA